MIDIVCTNGIIVADPISQEGSWALHHSMDIDGLGFDQELWTITHIPTGLALQNKIPEPHLALDLYQRVVERMPEPETLSEYLYLRELLVCWAYHNELIADTSAELRELGISDRLIAHLSSWEKYLDRRDR